MSGSNAAISFSSIASNARVPLFHVETDNTRAGASQSNPRTLIIGEVSASMAVAPVYVPSAAWAVTNLPGRLADMVAAYLANDPLAELWALPVQTSGGGFAAATGSITFTGTATAAGNIVVYVGGVAYPMAVAVGDTANALAVRLSTLIGLQVPPAAPRIPMGLVMASATTGVVTLTAVQSGAAGNKIDVRVNYRGIAGGEFTPAGITVSVTAMTGGTGTADLSTLGTILGDNNFDFIVCPFIDSTTLTSINTLMNDSTGRWSDGSQAFGHVWSANSDTVANLLTFGATVNNQHLTVFGMYDSPTPPWVQASAYAGAAAQALKADPARPLQTLKVTGVLAPPLASRMTKGNRQSLLSAGVATAIAERDGSIMIERAVTTYQTNRFGAADQSYLDTETLYTIMAVIRSLRSIVTQQWPRAKLADDGTIVGPGNAVVTPKLARSALISHYRTLEAQGLVQSTDAFAAGLIVQRNATDRSRLDVLYDPIIMSGLRIFAVLNQFRLAA